MLRGIYGPTDFDLITIDTTVSAEYKLFAICKAVPLVKTWEVEGKKLEII